MKNYQKRLEELQETLNYGIARRKLLKSQEDDIKKKVASILGKEVKLDQAVKPLISEKIKLEKELSTELDEIENELSGIKE